MIMTFTAAEFYNVMVGVVPLYMAMLLGYGSLRWWKLVQVPEQCVGIAQLQHLLPPSCLRLPFPGFQQPYNLSLHILAADFSPKPFFSVKSRIVRASPAVLSVLCAWALASSSLYSAKAAVARTSFDWVISIFMLATLPNTVIVGIPLLQPMYGEIALQVAYASSVHSFCFGTTCALFCSRYVQQPASSDQYCGRHADIQCLVFSIRIVSRDNSCATSDATESYSPPSSEIASAAGPAAATAAFATKPELDLSQGFLATKKEIVVHDHVSKQTFISINYDAAAQKEAEEAAVTHHVGRDSTESSTTPTTVRHIVTNLRAPPPASCQKRFSR
ncbi:unnamed protein product [Sphagnum balticum]